MYFRKAYELKSDETDSLGYFPAENQESYTYMFDGIVGCFVNNINDVKANTKYRILSQGKTYDV